MTSENINDRMKSGRFAPSDLPNILGDPLVSSAYEEYKVAIGELSSSFTAGGIHALQAALPMRATAYLPVALAEVFRVDDPTITQQAALAHLLLNHYAHLVDFVTDDDRSVHRAIVFHSSSLVLARVIVTYGDLVSSRSHFWKRWERYGLNASAAERRLWRHRGEIIAYDDLDFRSMAQKSSLLNSTAALYADIKGNSGILNDVELGLERLFLAVQLVDDLVDWESDLNSGIYSYPLWKVHSRISDLTPSDVGAELLRGHVAEEVIEQAILSLREARRILAPVQGLVLVALIDHLIFSLDQVCLQIQEAVEDVLQCPSEYDIRKYIRTIIDPRLAH